MSELREQQMAFAAHIRDPERNAAPDGIEDRRMAIYRALFFNSLANLLAGNFPVICRTLGEDAWRALVRRFYAEHLCATPLFTEVAREFVDWLQSSFPRRREPRPTQPNDDDASLDPRLRGDDMPWLPELAQYEWAELALAISDAPLPPHDANGDVVEGIPVASPHAWPLAYHWPVHRIGPDNVPNAPATTLLLVRRDDAGEVRFSELTPLAFRLLVAIDDNDANRTGADLLRELGGDTDAGTALLRRLHADGILLGTR